MSFSRVHRFIREKLVFLVPLIVVVAATADAGFQQAPAFRASTNVVQVDARVLRGDQFVRHLGPDDFVVTEDGVPQKVQSVVLVESPSRSSEPAQQSPVAARSASIEAASANPTTPAVWISSLTCRT